MDKFCHTYPHMLSKSPIGPLSNSKESNHDLLKIAENGKSQSVSNQGFKCSPFFCYRILQYSCTAISSEGTSESSEYFMCNR